ncbi:hypothetical protein K492DRAFT_178960 [Lichtheimia hyalospora FSU 10163]|nr:hypothetical protein K492DRAFT_178960 [Lichtheimia hyalospora FSU 10163]
MPTERDYYDNDMIEHRPNKSRKPPRRRKSNGRRRHSYYRDDHVLEDDHFYYWDPWESITMGDANNEWEEYISPAPTDYYSYYFDDNQQQEMKSATGVRRHKSTGTHQIRKQRMSQQPMENDHQVPQRWADIIISDEPLDDPFYAMQQQPPQQSIPERRRTIHEPRAPPIVAQDVQVDDNNVLLDNAQSPLLRRRHSLYEQPTNSHNLLMNSPPMTQQQPMTGSSPWVSPIPAQMNMMQQPIMPSAPVPPPMPAPMIPPHHSLMPPPRPPPALMQMGVGPMMHPQMTMPFNNPFTDFLGPIHPPMMHGAPLVPPFRHPAAGFGPPPPPPLPPIGPASQHPPPPPPNSSAPPASNNPPPASSSSQPKEIKKEEPKDKKKEEVKKEEEPKKEEPKKEEPKEEPAPDTKEDAPKQDTEEKKEAATAAVEAAAGAAAGAMMAAGTRALSNGGGELRRSKSLFGWFDKKKPPPAIVDRSRWDPSSVMSINDAAYRPAPRVVKNGLYPAGHPLNEHLTTGPSKASSSSSSSVLSRKESTRLNNKAQRLRTRGFIWCYRPMHHDVAGDTVVWAAFDVSNQDRLDPYIPAVIHHQPFHGALLVNLGSEPELPGLTMVRPLDGIGFHYKSALSSRPVMLEIRCLPNDNNLMVRQPPSQAMPMDTAPPLSFASNSSGGGLAGKLWNAIAK